MPLIAQSTHIQLLELQVTWWWCVAITRVCLHIKFLNLTHLENSNILNLYYSYANISSILNLPLLRTATFLDFFQELLILILSSMTILSYAGMRTPRWSVGIWKTNTTFFTSTLKFLFHIYCIMWVTLYYSSITCIQCIWINTYNFTQGTWL